MPVGISNLAHSFRTNASTDAVRISLGHAHQLVAAALGHGTLAAYQAAQAAQTEPRELDSVRHVVPDAAQLAERARELGIDLPPSRLQELLRLAFRERLSPVSLHSGFGDLETAIREHVDAVLLDDSEVVTVMASANYDGIDEVYFDYELEPDGIALGDRLDITLDGHIGLGKDPERPFLGDRVNVRGALKLERLGQRCFGAPEVVVDGAKIGFGWSNVRDDEDEEEGPQLVSRTGAFAQLLGLELDEVGALVDVEPQERSGSSDEMVYGYVLDFEPLASPEIAARIIARHGSLQVEVGPDYFDNVVDDDWPR